jgi:hypothetical protein
MDSFLYNIAKIYYEHHAADISDFTFVFPNRRAGLFFQKYLGEIAGKPLFSPKITTINEVFSNLSRFQTADRMGMLFRLYDIYVKLKIKSDGLQIESGKEQIINSANNQISNLVQAESFDEFAYWGELLLNDFDDIDKHLVDAKSLFTNVRELKEIDHIFDFLSEKQKSAIRQFWESFMPIAESSRQLDFIATWQILFSLYEEFRKQLSDSGIAYEGMIYREVAERLQVMGYELQVEAEYLSSNETNQQINKSPNNLYIFIGFNALTPAEKVFFKILKKEELADFYWDYDSPMIRDEKNLASRFIKENLLQFPSRYDIQTVETEHAPSLQLIGIPSTVGQAKEIHRILQEMQLNKDELLRTAVVLTDEKMLIPMLHSFPEDIEAVNITMGYPLQATSVANFVEQLFALQRSLRNRNGETFFYHIETVALLHHQYLKSDEKQNSLFSIQNLIENIKKDKKLFIETSFFSGNEVLETIFSPQKTAAGMADYLLKILSLIAPHQERLDREFLYHYYTAIKRIKDLLSERSMSGAELLMSGAERLMSGAESLINMKLDTFARLVKRLTEMITIPFEGEPLAGLQVMGVLETRALDFENLIITSFNEGSFPKHGASPSFIPYNLRKGFGLPTTEHQDAIFAYHFYRLAHRAKRIFLIYDTRSEGLQTGEVSRYAHQLKYHYHTKMEEKILSADISMKPVEQLKMEKSPEVMHKLLRYCNPQTNDALSASAINAYLDCGLKFYLQYVENLREQKELSETLEASDFGTIFHRTMENIYQAFEGKMVNKEQLQEMLKTPILVEKCLSDAYREIVFNEKSDELQATSDERQVGAEYSPSNRRQSSNHQINKSTNQALEGQHLLIANVIRKYVLKMLEIDAGHAPFVYVKSEYKTKCTVQLQATSDELQGKRVKIKGSIDRIDQKEGTLRLVDYKTGRDKSGSQDKRIFTTIESIFDAENAHRPAEALQVFLYAYSYKLQTTSDESCGGNEQILPSIIFVRNMFKDDLNFGFIQKEGKEKRSVSNFLPFMAEYEQSLKQCLEEIFNPAIPFSQTSQQKRCEYCPFKSICGR